MSDIAAALDRTLPVPLGVQLRGLIEYGIACGELPAGLRLPSVRDLAQAGGIAPMTVSTVYRDLQGTGLLVARPGSGTFVAEAGRGDGAALLAVRAHIDAALQAADAAGMTPADVAVLLNASIARARTREIAAPRVVLVGVFQAATEAYAQEIQRLLRAGGDRAGLDAPRIEAMTIATLTVEAKTLAAMRRTPPDLYVTLANRKAEVEALVGDAAPVVALSFIPSEQTRAHLAAIDPLARVGIVSVFPEFLALMKPGVLRFAPHLQNVGATLADDPALAAFVAGCDVLVFSTGAEAAVANRPAATAAIEYRHAPDPHAVRQVLVPALARLRATPAPIPEEAL